MKDEVEQSLLSLNRQFYDQFARPFAESRAQPQPGFYQLLEYIHPEDCTLLDVGCGDGRFGRFLSDNALPLEYTGIDFTEKFLQYARTGHHGTYLLRDISEPDCLDGLGQFDVIVCLATMQHLPGLRRRSRLLSEMAAHLTVGGRILLSNWQFLSSDRQRRKLVAWSEIGLSKDDVAAEDYLLSWQRDGLGYRYVAHLNEEATRELASMAGLRIIDQFRIDGREGDLNLYTILDRTMVDNR